MAYLILCKLENGNVIPAIANDFETAVATAEMFKSGDFTKEVTVISLETDTPSEFIV